jgi:hypothetical protein
MASRSAAAGETVIGSMIRRAEPAIRNGPYFAGFGFLDSLDRPPRS